MDYYNDAVDICEYMPACPGDIPCNMLIGLDDFRDSSFVSFRVFFFYSFYGILLSMLEIFLYYLGNIVVVFAFT